MRKNSNVLERQQRMKIASKSEFTAD